jgi:hypothetical protein
MSLPDRYPEGAAVHTDVMERRERTLGSDHLDTLRSVTSVGMVAHIEGRVGDAERLLVRALEGQTEQLGLSHVDTMTTMQCLTTLRGAQTMDDPATMRGHLGILQRAAELCGAEFGARDVRTINARQGVLGAIQSLCARVDVMASWPLEDEYPLASHLTQLRALAADAKEVLGSTHQSTWSVMMLRRNLHVLHDQADAVAQLDDQLLGDAEEEFGRSQKLWGPYHARTIAAARRIADCFQFQGAEHYPIKLIPQLRLVVNLTLQADGDRGRATMAARAQLATWLYACDSASVDSAGRREATAIWGELLPLQQEVLGEEHPDTLTTLMFYSSVLQPFDPSAALALQAQLLACHRRTADR